jgi:UDP-N-acetylmuramate dehydrogenase
MSQHTSLRIGGPAQALLTVKSVAELCQAVRWARGCGVQYYVIGGGTNLLVADAGLPGVVIVNRSTACSLVQTPAGVTVTAEAGLRLSTLAHQMAAAGWSGLEWAASVPGTLGGAVVGNAGAFGRNIADSLLAVRILGADGQQHDLPTADLLLGYRTSCFKAGSGSPHREAIVLSAELALVRGDRQTIAQTMEEVAHLRREMQPCDRPSAGSVFRNPPKDYAGRLIEAVGLKGARVGDAQVSAKHANFIINLGAATANDVLSLIQLIRARVRAQFEQELTLEIECVGWAGSFPDCPGCNECPEDAAALVQLKPSGKL